MKNKNNVSALSEHCKVCLPCISIKNFDNDFLVNCLDSLESTLTEAQLIANLNPDLNGVMKGSPLISCTPEEAPGSEKDCFYFSTFSVSTNNYSKDFFFVLFRFVYFDDVSRYEWLHHVKKGFLK